MNDTRDFSWEVVKNLGNFSEGRENYSKELNIITWNGRPPVFDLRGWRIGKDGIKHPLKGISMSMGYDNKGKKLVKNLTLIGGAIMAQNLTYTQCGDYFIPDIRLAHTEAQILGKYGRMRRIFLEQNKPILFNDMKKNSE